MGECRVSVIIPAYNARSLLPACLGALQAAAEDPSAFEVIVIDDNSTDDTAAVARGLGAQVIELKENAGPARARNIGAGKARGEYLFFVDADTSVHPGAVDRIRDFLDQNTQAAAVFGSYDDRPLEKGLLTEYRNLLHHFVHQHGRREASTFWSGCGAIRREIFQSVGGYDDATHPRCIEDIEMGYRLRAAGHSIILDPGLFCTHMKRWTVRSWLKTDIWCRAIPWTKLNLLSAAPPDDLNIKKSQKLSVLAVGLAALGLVLALVEPWFLAAAALLVLLVVLLNGTLFRFFCRTRGVFFALACVPLHLAYFFYSGLSFAYVVVAFKLGLSVRDGNCPPR